MKLALFMLVASANAKHLSDAEMLHFYGLAKPLDFDLLTPKDASQTLRAAAAARGVFIGAAVAMQHINNASDPMFNSTAATQFNLMTAENDCKWGATEPSENGYTLQACSTTAEWADGFAISHRLHNLAWGADNPGWVLANGFSAAQLQGFLEGHATKLVTSFATAYCTDVVNEAVSDTGGPDVILKASPPWYPALTNYLPIAFNAARAANPNIKLFYNDYGAEGLGTKSDKVYNLLKGLISGGVPVDGVGLQMHISVDSYPSPADVSTNMARLVALGLEVHVTEMDVRCTPPCGADRLTLQAGVYGGILQACLNNTKPTNPNGKGGCKSFETWGVSDLYTWLWDFENPTHQDMQPLLWDLNYNVKPAFTQVLAVLQA